VKALNEMTNPYMPPAEAPIATAKMKLYSPGQIAGATFLGSPIAGCVLMTLNYRRMGDSTAANLALILGAIGTIGIIAMAFVLPDGFPNMVLPAAYTYLIYRYAKTAQGQAFDNLIAQGGRKGSGWAVLGVAALCLLLVFAAIIAVLLVMPEEWLDEDF